MRLHGGIFTLVLLATLFDMTVTGLTFHFSPAAVALEGDARVRTLYPQIGYLAFLINMPYEIGGILLPASICLLITGYLETVTTRRSIVAFFHGYAMFLAIIPAIVSLSWLWYWF